MQRDLFVYLVMVVRRGKIPQRSAYNLILARYVPVSRREQLLF